MKKAFSLVELLVVIAIIAILAGVLMSSFGSATDSARLARCQSNLKNLAAAMSSYAMESEHFPYAGSAQYMTSSLNEAGDIQIGVHKGWISWLDKGMFKGQVTSEKSVSQSSYVGNEEDILHALTNGAVWRAAGMNRSVYQCPIHQKTCLSVVGKQPGWSYAMNPYFGYEREKGKAMASSDEVIRPNDLLRADRRLLLAEIPGLDPKKIDLAKYGATKLPNMGTSAGSEQTDGILQYESEDEGVVGGNVAESIGFNHVRGKRLVGLVAFADGHTESLTLPKDGNFEKLTGWLCEGCDVTFTADSYKKIDKSNVE